MFVCVSRQLDLLDSLKSDISTLTSQMRAVQQTKDKQDHEHKQVYYMRAEVLIGRVRNIVCLSLCR
jgi:glucan phosphorylase